ncbi:FAD:protein FMN transferase, partial [Gammaproteobacteria bacterium]|nr:FAD:protein FMN transferase [Gammaproteobacteria bacterium]
PAIEAPLSGLSQIYEIFLSRGDSIAVAGSGDYRNYFEVDGVRYSHEIDPRSGRPIEHTLAAVTVIDESAMRADALATAYMIMGVEAAKKTADAAGQAAYFIVRSRLGASGEPRFEAQHTEAFARYLVR